MMEFKIILNFDTRTIQRHYIDYSEEIVDKLKSNKVKLLQKCILCPIDFNRWLFLKFKNDPKEFPENE